MSRAHTTEFLFDNADHFLARLDNDGVRVGMKDFFAIDYPAGHARTSEVLALSAETVEEFFAAEIEAGRISLC